MESRRQGRSSSNLDNKGAAVVHSHKLSAMQKRVPWDLSLAVKKSQLDLNTDYAQMVPIVEARRAVLAERASRPVKNDHVAPFFPNRRSKKHGSSRRCFHRGNPEIFVDLDSAFFTSRRVKRSRLLPDRRISNTKRLAVVSESMVDLENSDMFQDIENYIANIRSQKQLTKESNPDRRMESFEDFHTVKASLEKPDISGGTGAVVDKLITGGKKIAVKKSSEEKIHKGSQNRD
ncbi:unnamed protein product [Caenorhabditis auriculariae]|uniref:Uncharacterized protein n=1 Tax=Caenorhabditis auriculariae TaxID=2777116 RepID=A0A8S1H9P9_9PELO|nr:unnamed protein product [Caenorhabditis auriculariae]